MSNTPNDANLADQLHAAVFGADEILVNVEFLAEHWADLGESRRIGSPRPWRQALLDPDQRAQRLARDRLEREVRDPDAPGFTSAPEHLDVLDVIVDAWIVLDELAHLISPDWRNTTVGGGLDRQAAQHQAPLPIDDIARPLELIRTWLRPALPELPPARIASISRRLHTVTSDVSRVLALVRAGQLLAGAVCPWCKGVTPKHPEGGATTMRVEEIPGSRHLGTDPAAAVVCWNPLCEPPTDACGSRLRGRPTWPWHEWDWLAKQLIVAEPQRSQPPPPPSRPPGFSDTPVLPIERFGISGVSRSAPPAHDPLTTPVDGLVGSDAGYSSSDRVQFVGGPFADDVRKFVRIERELTVTRDTTGRVRLGSTDAIDEHLGVYRYELVNDQPSYVWTAS